MGAFSLLSFFPPQKKFSLLFFSLSLFTAEKASEEKKKKVRLKSIRRRRKNRRRREILVAFTTRKFLFTRFSHSFFVVKVLLCGLLLSSRSYFCCIFSRATHHWRRTFAREKRGLAIFFIRTLGARKKRGWCFGGRRERVDADFEL